MHRVNSPLRLAAGLVGLVLGILSEWQWWPFLADEGLAFFLAHLREVRPPAQVMIVLGAILAFWLGRSRPGLARSGGVP